MCEKNQSQLAMFWSSICLSGHVCSKSWLLISYTVCVSEIVLKDAETRMLMSFRSSSSTRSRSFWDSLLRSSMSTSHAANVGSKGCIFMNLKHVSVKQDTLETLLFGRWHFNQFLGKWSCFEGSILKRHCTGVVFACWQFHVQILSKVATGRRRHFRI